MTRKIPIPASGPIIVRSLDCGRVRREPRSDCRHLGERLMFLRLAPDQPHVMQICLGAFREVLTLPAFLCHRLTIANDAELPVGPRNEMGGVAGSEFGRA